MTDPALQAHVRRMLDEADHARMRYWLGKALTALRGGELTAVTVRVAGRSDADGRLRAELVAVRAAGRELACAGAHEFTVAGERTVIAALVSDELGAVPHHSELTDSLEQRVGSQVTLELDDRRLAEDRRKLRIRYFDTVDELAVAAAEQHRRQVGARQIRLRSRTGVGQHLQVDFDDDDGRAPGQRDGKVGQLRAALVACGAGRCPIMRDDVIVSADGVTAR